VRIERQAAAAIASSVPIAVVIDVLRATSTAAVLLARGAARVRVTSLDIARAIAGDGRHLVVSECIPGGIDNSPTAAASVPLDGRTPLLVTTNGTKALERAARFSERVLVASFLNLGATVAHLRGLRPTRVMLLAAGDFETGEKHVEDDLCAASIAGLLEGEPLEMDAVAARISAEPRVQERVRTEPGLAADLRLCLTADAFPAAIELVRDSGELWLERLV
jgi:2-phosphosulfolactate phosphatase